MPAPLPHRLATNYESPPVIAYYRVTDAQSKTHPLAYIPGGKEGIEDAIDRLLHPYPTPLSTTRT